MIFITNQNTIVNIPKSMYSRDFLFYEAVHIALFQKHIPVPNFTNNIKKTIEDMV